VHLFLETNVEEISNRVGARSEPERKAEVVDALQQLIIHDQRDERLRASHKFHHSTTILSSYAGYAYTVAVRRISMATGLARVEYRPTEIGTEQLGAIMVKSGYFKDTREEAQAIVKILYGAELGFGPIASMLGCYIVDGRPSLSAQLIASAIQKSGAYRYRVREWTETLCRIEFFERGESLGESTFSMEDANRAGLAAKQTWKQYPKAMLWARAMSQGARAYTPDVFNGSVYTPDELGAVVDHEGRVLEANGRTVDRDTGEVLDEAEPYVPTREEEVDDEDLVRTTDDPLWKQWEKLRAMAIDADIRVQDMRLGCRREELKAYGADVKRQIQSRRASVA
jgi:hypothetical protein